MKRQILYVNATGRLGGAENSLLQLVRGLDRSRFVPVAAVPETGQLAERLKESGCAVAPIPELRVGRTANPARLAAMGLRWLRAIEVVAGATRRWDARLIHSNSTAAHLIGCMGALIARVPALWHVRDMLQAPLVEWLADYSTHQVIYCSTAVQEVVKLPMLHGVSRHVVPNALDIDRFRRGAEPGDFRRELGCGSETRIVLMVAQLVPWKRHLDMVRAFERIEERVEDVKLILAGSDMFGEHPEYVGDLKVRVRESGLDGAVEFIGQRDDIPTVMCDSDVVVIPSRREPFGRVALEAMAMEKPVVASGDAGLAGIVEHERTGLLVQPGRLEELAQAIEHVITSPEEARRMGQAGFKRVKSEFGVQDHCRKVENIYESILDSCEYAEEG